MTQSWKQEVERAVLLMLHSASIIALDALWEKKQLWGSQACEETAVRVPGFAFGKVSWACGEEGLWF